MGQLNDFTLVAKDGSVGRRDSTLDMICGFLTNGVAVGTLALGATNQLKSIEDLEALGLLEAYDTTNNVKVHHHVKEFFRMNPSGTLWLMLVAQTVSMEDMVDVSNSQYSLKLLNDAKGTIRTLGVGRCPAVGYTPTTTGGMDIDVFAAIPKAQELAAQEYVAHRPVYVVLEGRSFTGAATSATDLRTLNSPSVSVAILQDKVQAATHAINAGYAAIGTTLGVISKARVNASIMATEAFDIQNVAREMYLLDDANDNVNLSSNLAVSSYSDTDLGTLKDKGYLFALTYTDYQGVYFCDSSSCNQLDSKFAYIEDSRVKNKVTRILYPEYIAKLGAVIEVDEETGFLEEDVVTAFEEIGENKLGEMRRDKEISGADVIIDPAQNLLVTSEMKIAFSVTRTGTLRNITGEIVFPNPFNT